MPPTSPNGPRSRTPDPDGAAGPALRLLVPAGLVLLAVGWRFAFLVWTGFSIEADEAVLGRMLRVAAKIAEDEGIAEDGYRLMINCRDHGGQEVYHVHLHLLGGRPLGPMLAR